MNTALLERVKRLRKSLSDKPGYTLMRGLARFSILKISIPFIYGVFLKIKGSSNSNNNAVAETCFDNVDVDSVVSALKKDGVAFGLKLPEHVVHSIRQYADEALCFADREAAYGFKLSDREAAEKQLDKKILVAQYFNTASENPEIARLFPRPGS